MNIHFKDKALLQKLKEATLFTTIMGSHMYGTNDENSDIDLLHIYVPSISERNSFYPSHHQLQYKEENTDHNFVNIFAFLKNCLNGDSSVNFEVINHESIKGSSLGFLYEMREAFYNYKILRSFNGFCRRDLRELHKSTSDLEKNKRICHIIRGHEFAKMILKKNFSPVAGDELKKRLAYVKNISDNHERKELINEMKSVVEDFRIEITRLHDHKELNMPTFMSVDDQEILEFHMSELINSDLWESKSDWRMSLTCFFQANENPEIKY